jgi:hypothetical protein
MAGIRFWVVGGEFRSFEFDELMEGTERVFGPFASRAAAEAVWRDTSERHRSQGTVRFSIVAEPARAA